MTPGLSSNLHMFMCVRVDIHTHSCTLNYLLYVEILQRDDVILVFSKHHKIVHMSYPTVRKFNKYFEWINARIKGLYAY